MMNGSFNDSFFHGDNVAMTTYISAMIVIAFEKEFMIEI